MRGEKEKKWLSRFGEATRCKVVVNLKGYKLGTSELLIVLEIGLLESKV